MRKAGMWRGEGVCDHSGVLPNPSGTLQGPFRDPALKREEEVKGHIHSFDFRRIAHLQTAIGD